MMDSMRFSVFLLYVPAALPQRSKYGRLVLRVTPKPENNYNKSFWNESMTTDECRVNSSSWYSRTAMIQMQQKGLVPKLFKCLIVMSVHVAFEWKPLLYHQCVKVTHVGY